MIVRDFQSVIGRETLEQCLKQIGRLPDLVVACVGGGSNAAGMFYPFVDDASVKLVGVEAGGRIGAARRTCLAAQSYGSAGRAARQLQLRDAGRRRPDLRRAFDLGRAGLSRRRPGAQLLERRPAACEYTSCRDDERPRRVRRAGPAEGILPALESSHAVAKAMELARGARRTKSIVVCLSGRGDKDAAEIARLRGVEMRRTDRVMNPIRRRHLPSRSTTVAGDSRR